MSLIWWIYPCKNKCVPKVSFLCKNCRDLGAFLWVKSSLRDLLSVKEFTFRNSATSHHHFYIILPGKNLLEGHHHHYHHFAHHHHNDDGPEHYHLNDHHHWPRWIRNLALMFAPFWRRLAATSTLLPRAKNPDTFVFVNFCLLKKEKILKGGSKVVAIFLINSAQYFTFGPRAIFLCILISSWLYWGVQYGYNIEDD